ncbi:unnamed protein product [Amoebophrya sp. A120]|nr:unnamed protein product [Amoebophrya sp. A120]|eukprot:GSA120T00003836001.1
MPLLGRDHLTRGQSHPPRPRTKFCFAATEVFVCFVVYALLFSSSPLGTDKGFSLSHGLIYFLKHFLHVKAEAVDSFFTKQRDLDEKQKLLLFFGAVFYSLKVTTWNFCLNHTESVTLISGLFIGGCFHLFFFSATVLLAILAFSPHKLSTTNAVLCSFLLVSGLALELYADYELHAFKRRKLLLASSQNNSVTAPHPSGSNIYSDRATSGTSGRAEERATYDLDRLLVDDSSSTSNLAPTTDKAGAQPRLLTTGLHAYSRHPSYFFNCFSFLGYAGLSGFFVYGIVWFLLMVAWVYFQSGPALEKHMAVRYGEEWSEYCKQVPFFWPKKLLLLGFFGSRRGEEDLVTGARPQEEIV